MFVGQECHFAGVTGYGSQNAEVMFIISSPNAGDARQGIPLSGSSGELLDSVLGHFNLDREYMYTTSLMCWKNDAPTEGELLGCLKRLDQELREIKPHLVITIGKLASEFFINHPFSKSRGGVFWSERWQTYFMPTYHPGAILHAIGEKSASSKDDKASKLIYDFVRDLRKIEYVLETLEAGAPQAKVDYECCDTIERAQQVLDLLPRDGTTPVAVDVETDSAQLDEIDIFADKLLSVAISTPDSTWVFPPDIAVQLNWPVEEIVWTFQNGCFDTQVIAKHCGVWLPIVEDTMLQSYSLDERQGVHGLKPQAREFLAAGFWEEDREKGKKRLSELEKDVLYLYNAKDAAYTARLCMIYRPWQLEDNVREMYNSILIPLANVLNHAQYDGVTVNRKLLNYFAVKWGQLYLEKEEELQYLANSYGWPGDDPLNLQSPKQLARFLYDILLLPGGPSTDKEHLEALKGKHPFIDKLLDFRHLSHIYDSYITSPAQYLKDDNKFHPIPKQHGTKTGRLSYTKPAVQTVPQVYDSLYGRIREMYIGDTEDYEIMEADYGKAEIWTAHGYSKDKQMLIDLLSGDYHTKVAAQTTEKPESEITPEERRDAKAVTFGTMYAIGERSLAKDIDKPVLVARKYIKNFFKRFFDFHKFTQELKDEVRATGVYQTLTGRKRRFIPIGSDIRMLKQAVNYPIQSTSGDMTQIAMIRIDKPLRELGGRILFQVHDSIVCHIPKANRDACIKLVHDVMTSELIPGFTRIPVEVKVGPNWGKTKTVHDCIEEGCFKWMLESVL